MVGGAESVADLLPANGGFCEGFRMTAHRMTLPRALGRRRKASSERTRGRLSDEWVAAGYGDLTIGFGRPDRGQPLSVVQFMLVSTQQGPTVGN